MVTCNQSDLAAKILALSQHGSRTKYIHEWVGINSRLDALQAAVLLAKLPHLDTWTAARQSNAAFYRRSLAGLPITLPQQAIYQTNHVYNQFVIRSSRRDHLKQFLAEQGVGTEIYYPLPLHMQPCYQYLGYNAGDLPESEQAARQVLALPIHPTLTPEDLSYVVTRIHDFHN